MHDSEQPSGSRMPSRRRWPRPVVWLLAGAAAFVTAALGAIFGGWILFRAYAPPELLADIPPGPSLSRGLQRPIMTAINGWTLFVVLTSDPFDDRRFDRGVWLAMHGSQDRDNPRGPMARDVQRILLEAKMSRAQVREMLGSPDGHETPSLWQYTLGMWSGFRIDYDSLDVHFDGGDRVSNAILHQH